jgi:hypothetical protein
MALTKVRGDGADGLTLSSTDLTITSGDLIFGTSGKGPVIGSTSNTDGNTLDDYEEGTFSPTLKNEGDTNLSTTKNTTYNNARYVKVGPVVFIQMTVNISALSGDSGSQNLIVDNLPFTSRAYQANANGGFNITYQSNVDTNSTYGVVLGSSDDMRFYSAPTTPLYSNALQSASYIQMYGHYETAS